jgi:hypothetical protein
MRYQFLLYLVACLTIGLRGQKTLEGSFHEVTGMWAQEWNTLIFYKDQSFIFEKISDFGDYQGYGTYELSYDSLILNFQKVPEELRHNRIIESPSPTGGGTLVQTRNGLNANARIQVGYSLHQGDSLLENGNADLFGNIYLDSGLTNVKLSLFAVDADSKYMSRIYGVQEIEMEHTNARSILVLFTYKPGNVAYIEGGELRLKSRVMQNGNRLKLIIKSGDFYHPNPGTVYYTLTEE